MRWTTEKPTESGIYWYRWSRSHEGDENFNYATNLVLIDFDKNQVSYLGREDDEIVAEHLEGRWVDHQEWCGPIASHVAPTHTGDK